MGSIGQAYAALMVATSVASVCGNVLLLLLVALNRSLRTETWFIDVAVTACNLSFGLTIVPFGAHNSMFLAWGGASELPLCQAGGFLLVLLQLGTVNTVALATADRFIQLCFEAHHARLVTRERGLLALGLVGLGCLLGAACPLLGAGAFGYAKTKFLCVPSFSPRHAVFSTALLMLGNVVPIVAMGGLCAGAACIGRSRAPRGSFVGEEQHFPNPGDYFRSYAGMTLSVACVLVTCSPYVTVCFYETYTGRSLTPTPDAMIIWLMLSPSALDPWLNLITQKKYRDALKESVRKLSS